MPGCNGRRTFNRGRTYPLILDIHGGPHSAYGWASITSSNGWRRLAISCCIRIREAARVMVRSSATSFSTGIRVTTIGI